MKTIRIYIKNMTCDACVRLSKLKISKIIGVREVRISDLNGQTEIMADRDIELAEIRKSLADTNYQVI